jgi:hypothetical protein
MLQKLLFFCICCFLVPSVFGQTQTILKARQQPVGTNVSVRGIVTAQFGLVLYVQDATAGVPLYLGSGVGAFAVGDSVSASGSVQAFNNQVQIGTGSAAVTAITNFGKAKNGIQPKTIKTNQLAANEGSLVKINATIFTDKKGIFYPDNNLIVTTADGAAEVRVSRLTDIAGYYKPQITAEIVGVVGRFKDVYQLQPRTKNDIGNIGAFYGVSGKDINRNTTLDVASWNLNWFGSTASGYGPTNKTLQLSNIKRVIDSLQADIYTLVEVANPVAFDNLLSQMPSFSGKCSPSLTVGIDPNNAQRVCFLYKTAIFQNPTFRSLLKGVNTANLVDYPGGSGSKFWASGRLPFMMTADVVIGGITNKINFVGIHARANVSTDNAEVIYRQRRYDVKVLKDSLDAQFGTVPVIITGDYNDDVDETVSAISSTKESSFKDYTDDGTKYKVVTRSLSDAGLRSYMTYENVIDHITITDELFQNPVAGSEGHEMAFLYVSDYANTTSDHLPVFARFKLTPSPVLSLLATAQNNLLVYPNPVENNEIFVQSSEPIQSFKILTISGQESDLLSYSLGENQYRLVPSFPIQSGLYVLKAESKNGVYFQKIVVR